MTITATRKKTTDPVQTAEPDPIQTKTVKTAVIALNVHKEPDDDSPIVARIKGREIPVPVSEEKAGWLKMANGLGWIRKEYIEHF